LLIHVLLLTVVLRLQSVLKSALLTAFSALTLLIG